MALWITETFAIKCLHVRDLGLRHAEDPVIFQRARDSESVVVMTKDEDFVELVTRHGLPPQVLWVRCGNMSNAHFKVLLRDTFPDAWSLIESGEPIVEINRKL